MEITFNSPSITSPDTCRGLLFYSKIDIILYANQNKNIYEMQKYKLNYMYSDHLFHGVLDTVFKMINSTTKTKKEK